MPSACAKQTASPARRSSVCGRRTFQALTETANGRLEPPGVCERVGWERSVLRGGLLRTSDNLIDFLAELRLRQMSEPLSTVLQWRVSAAIATASRISWSFAPLSLAASVWNTMQY